MPQPVAKVCPRCRAKHWLPSGLCRQCLAGRPVCRHCGAANACRPRGLCYVCYETPGVRRLHPARPPGGKAAEVRDYNGPSPPADRPAAACLGQPGKVLELARRAALGLCLWHEGDAEPDLE